LGGNPFGAPATAAIARLLCQNAFLTSLEIEKSCMTKDDIKPFVDTIKKNNFSLIRLVLGHKTEQNSYRKGGFYGVIVTTNYPKPIQDHIDKFVNRNIQKRNPLFMHVMNEAIPQVMKILKDDKVSPLCIDEQGNTLLHVAVRKNPPNMQLITTLIKRHCHPLQMNNQRLNVIDLLDANSPPELHELLTAAVDNREIAAVAVAAEPLKKKIKAEAPEVPASNSLRNFFSPQKKPEAAKPPAEAQAPSPQKPIQQNTNPSHLAYYAALNDDARLLKSCLTQIDLDHQYADGNTIWHLAASKHAEFCLHVLASQKKGAHITNGFLQAPLHVACLCIENMATLETLEILIANNKTFINSPDVFGQTPLFCLTGGFNYRPNAGADNMRAMAAKILLKHGADPNITIADLNNQGLQCSILQKSISRGLYRMVKVLVASPLCDLSHRDGKGNTALHYTIMYSQFAILTRLLIQPQLDLKITNYDGVSARQMLRDSLLSNPQKMQIDAFFEKRELEYLPPLASDEHWTRQLVIQYGSKMGRKHDLKIDFKDEHSALQNSLRENGNTVGNSVTASLTFIVSNGTHQPGQHLQRIPIKIEMTFGEKAHVRDTWQTKIAVEKSEKFSRYREITRSRDALGSILQRFHAAPADIQSSATDNLQQKTEPLSAQAIEMLFQTIDETQFALNFEQRFHHSEQALFEHLQRPDIIDNIIAHLRNDRQYIEGCKVYAVIINQVSKFYMCADCRISTFGFQNTQQGVFFTLLQQQLLAIGCSLPQLSPLRAITLFSSNIPYQNQKKTANEHKDVTIDLRAYPNNQILCQDSSEFRSSATAFDSRK
ncbi:MAG: hypothetical protein M3R00_09080, partial [Pseudomonadota bacterium]|nr:hypothetical protein [Pseudomonadota bacterium]